MRTSPEIETIKTFLAGRRKGYLAMILVGVLLLFLLVVSRGRAVHDLGLFELDRNAEDNGSVDGEDWNTLYDGGANTGGNSADFTGILPDIGADGGTQFHGGGSKDDLDITAWRWQDGEPLDKDDITNAYAAAYVNTQDTGQNDVGDLIVYFGLDRFSANGSAQVGFWFLQDPSFGLTNTFSKGGFKFDGAHMDNDILVQSNFSNGGVIENITVYKWESGALVEVLNVADCLGPPSAGSDDPACATVNRSPQNAPWPYTPKANEGDPGTFLTSAFFEGGINITRLVPEAGCFTGFVAETRSSTPFDARLKDFVLGEFNLCSANIQIEEDDANQVGTAHDFTVTVNQVIAGVESPAEGADVTVDFTGSLGATPSPAQDTCTTDASGECTVTVNSTTTGLISAHASTTIEIFGDSFTAETDGVAPNSDDALKRYVDARLTLTPPEDANQVGDDHAITAHLEFDYGDGAGFVDAPSGETIEFTKDSGPGSLLSTSCSTDANGECSVTLQSNVTGETEVSASWTGDITTAEGTASASTSATPVLKRWVDARLTLTPAEDANQVGSDHVITALLEFDYGDGSGFVTAPDGETIDLSTDLGTLSPSSCDTDGGDGNCTVTLTSASTGLSTISASWEGQIFTTVGAASATADAADVVKRWVDARLTLTPPEDANQVGSDHLITAHLEFDYGNGLGFVDAPDGETIDLSTDFGTLSASSCDTDGGDGNCTVTLTSAATGLSTISGSWSGDIVTAEGTASASASATPVVKRWVDAQLTLTPAKDANQVGSDHIITAHLQFDYGDGNGFVDAPDGETIDLSTDFGTLSASSCDTDGGDGNCTVTLTSAATGLSTISGSWSGDIVTAEGTASASASATPVVKRWVDARLTLTPAQDANQVGSDHIITAHLQFDYGDGGGFVNAPAGETINFTKDSGPGSLVSSSCTTDASGQCSVTLQSAVTGLTTVSASWTGTIATAEGNASASTSATPVVKRWVDARLTLTPAQDDNGITEPHDIVAKLEFDYGDGAGFVAAPDGETINLSTDFGSFASNSTVTATSCDTAGGTGECTVTLYSDVAGTANITANWSGTISTAEGNAAATAGPANASKTWHDGSLRWFKHDGEGNLLGGATFEVQRIADRFGDPVSDAPITVVDNGANDNDPDAGEFELVDLLLGTYTVRETQAPEGYRGDLDRLETVSLTLANPDVVISEAWVNVPIGRAQLTPTGTECEAFITETATDLQTLERSGSGQLSPGAFIYFNEIPLASGTNTIEVSVASDPGSAAEPLAFDIKLYTFNEQSGQCRNISNRSDVTITLVDNVVTFSVPGSYGEVVTYVKYSPPDDNPDVGTTYTFTTRLNGAIILSDSLTVVDNQ